MTALFADVVGSTALGERLDPEEVKLVVGGTINRAVHAIDGYGGTVQNLAGDGVLALFGAPVAREDDPYRAIMNDRFQPWITVDSAGLTMGAGSALWFSDGKLNRVGRVSLNGTTTEYALP